MTTAMSGSPSAVTPFGIGMSQRRITVSGCMSVMSMTNSFGMSVGRAADFDASRRPRRPGHPRPHGLGLALEADGDVDGDLLVHVDLEEVDVVDRAPDRVALHLLDDGRVAACHRPAAPARCWRRPGPLSARRSSRRSTVTLIGSIPRPYSTPGM